MTLTELQAKRTEILQSLGIAAMTFGERSIQYSDQKKALAIIDGEIAATSSATKSTIGVFYTREGL